MNDLKGKVAIVTGGGAGIGRAIVFELAERGATVAVGEISAESGRATEDELQRRFGAGSFVQTDISDPAQTRALIDTVTDTHGRLDILVNNAGINFVKPTLEVTDQEWNRVMDVDLRGTFIACRQALRVMQRQRSGSIVNIGSVHATATISGAAAYAAAKAAVVQLTRALAVEFGEFGIRINCVSPGAIATQIWKDAEAASAHPEKFREHWCSHIPSNRTGTPEEVARAVAFVASDEASYLSGANLVLDSGLTSMLTSRERG